MRRSPLMLALGLALLPGLGLAIWLGPARHATPSRPIAAATSTPSPLPTPTAVPTPLPLLAVADRLDLGAPRGFGRVFVHPFSPLGGDFPIAAYLLATTPGSFPGTLPVWRLRGFASGDVAALGDALGIPTTGTPPAGDDLDASHARVRSTITHLDLPGAPDTTAAIGAAATALLRHLGVPALDADLQVSEFDPAPHEYWDVEFIRHRLAGVQVGMEPASEASLTVEHGSIVTSVDVNEQAVDGGSSYPLRDWRSAWADVRAGHWLSLCCPGPNGNPGPDTDPGGRRYTLRVSKVYLYYEESGDLLVPYYAFQDERFGIAVGVPALQAADVGLQR